MLFWFVAAALSTVALLNCLGLIGASKPRL